MLAVTGVAETWHVYVIAFVFGIGAAFDAPARQSFVSEMVGQDDLTNAVGLNSAAFNAARILGPALAGLMIGALGGGADGHRLGDPGQRRVVRRGDLAAAADEPRAAAHPRAARPRTPAMLVEGVRYVRSQPKMILILIMVFFAGTFGMNFQITSALMATEVFDKGATEYGVLGSVDGGRLADRRADRRPPGPGPAAAAGRRRARLRRWPRSSPACCRRTSRSRSSAR